MSPLSLNCLCGQMFFIVLFYGAYYFLWINQHGIALCWSFNGTYEPASISQRISLARLQTAVSTCDAWRLGTGNQIADSFNTYIIVCVFHMEWQVRSICSNHISFLKPLLKLQHSWLVSNQLWSFIANATHSEMHFEFPQYHNNSEKRNFKGCNGFLRKLIYSCYCHFLVQSLISSPLATIQ
jgi:hypothetical protein